MTYAHITGDAIDQIGALPRLWHDGSRWWDLRDRDPGLLASLGWLPVVESPRPDDSDTDTHEPNRLPARLAQAVANHTSP